MAAKEQTSQYRCIRLAEDDLITPGQSLAQILQKGLPATWRSRHGHLFPIIGKQPQVNRFFPVAMEGVVHAVIFIVCQRPAVASDDNRTAYDLRFRQSHIDTAVSRLYVRFPVIGIAPDLHNVPSDLSLFIRIGTAPFLQRPFHGQPGTSCLMRQGFVALCLQLETAGAQTKSRQDQTDN